MPNSDKQFQEAYHTSNRLQQQYPNLIERSPSMLSKADLEDFISWLKTKPPHGHWEYSNPTSCLLAHYLKDRGHHGVVVTSQYFQVGNGWGYQSLPAELAYLVQSTSPQTYEAALTNAEYLLNNPISP
jgi:hypothetical protein